MSGCCPEGSHGNPPFPGYSWNDKGVVDQVGHAEDLLPSRHDALGGGHEGLQDWMFPQVYHLVL